MNNNDEEQSSNMNSRARDHLANERTFLAWIRTSIGIMAFGFVVEKFALFTKQIAFFLGKSASQLVPDQSHTLQGYSSIFGVFLVVLGMVISLLAFLKYKNIENQIEKETFKPSISLNVLLTLCVLIIGFFLAVYLNSGFW